MPPQRRPVHFQPLIDPQKPEVDTLRSMLSQHRSLLIASAILGLVAAAVYVRLATPIYSTTSRIFLQKSGSSGDGQAGSISENVLDTQCELLKSSPILAVAINASGAEHMRMFGNGHSRIAYLKKYLDVELASRGSCITVTLNSAYPDEARAVIDGIAAAYKDFQGKQQHSVAMTALTLLEQDKGRSDAELDAKSKQLTDLRDAQRGESFGTGSDGIALQRMSTLSQALTAAQMETLTAKGAYTQAAAAAGIDVSVPDWIEKNAPDINDPLAKPTAGPAAESEDAARAELFQLRQQRDGLSKQFMPGHPTIQALNAKINDLSKSLLASARRRWLTATENEHQLQDSFDRQQDIVVTQSHQNAAVANLESEIKREQQHADTLDKHIGELTSSTQNGSLEIPMIEPAAISESPVWPRAWELLPLGLLAGLLVGAGSAWAWESSGGEKIAASKSGGKEMLGLPVFASVPRQGEVSIRHVAWSAHLRPESTIAQAFRSVKDGLDTVAAGTTGLTQARTILIASPLNGEGRTIAASNLAITLAKSGKRVCLIDADLRSPSLAKVYAMRDDFGLVEILQVDTETGQSMTQAIDRAVQRSVIERLDLIPAGGPAENPEALLNRPSLAEALEELTLKYDHIVIDGPSVLSAADSRIIAASCDATILLLSQEASTRKVGEQCRDGLTGVGATLIGVIVNSAPRLTGSNKPGGLGTRTERIPPVRRALPADSVQPERGRPESSRPALPLLPHKSRV